MSRKKNKVNHIPQSIADSIPYYQVYENGVFENRPGCFSKSYRLPTANFKTLSIDSQVRKADAWSQFLGNFDPDVTVEVTYYNKTTDINKFKESVLMPMQPDAFNASRDEINNITLDRLTGAKNNLNQEKYLTVSFEADDITDAGERFARIEGQITESMTQIAQNDATPLSAVERLDILNSIYNPDSSVPLHQKRQINGVDVETFSLENCRKQGITTKDVIQADGLKFMDYKFQIGEYVARSYYVNNFPTWIKATLLGDLASIPCNLLVSVYYQTIGQDESVRMIRRQRTNISSDLLANQKKASRGGYDPSLVNPDISEAKDEASELMDEMIGDNTKLFTVTIVVTLIASDEAKLKVFETQLKSVVSKNLLNIKKLGYQQEEGFNSSLPLANKQITMNRLATTKTVASLIPFDTKEINQPGGVCYGINAESRNLILYDRTTSINPNGCILGMPGGGKSVTAKQEIINTLLRYPEDEVYVIDPEGEYRVITDAYNGFTLKLATGASQHLNPFDLNILETGDDGDPIKVKTDYIASLMEPMIGGRYGLSPLDISIIHRCVRNIYDPYLDYLHRTGKDIDQEHAPTMRDFYEEMLSMPEQDAQRLALSLERFVDGSDDMFSHHTNVDTNNRFVVYDIKDVRGMKQVGVHVCLNNIWNKMITNKAKGKRTWFYIDEFYILMNSKLSASYVAEIWKRARKWGGIPTAITQNVEDMLKSEEARTVINNCALKILLAQSPTNKQQLSKMLDISPEEQKYISTTKPGLGLICVGSDILPVDSSIPTSSNLYSLVTTKPSETK